MGWLPLVCKPEAGPMKGLHFQAEVNRANNWFLN